MTWDSLLQALRDELATAVLAPGHPWRWGVLVTGASSPTGRTVVLRHFEQNPDALVAYTDVRSSKVDTLRQDPRAVWVFYDPTHRRQLQLTTTVRVHCRDFVAEKAWKTVPANSRRDYGSFLPPGTPVSEPLPPLRPSEQPEVAAGALENFAVLHARIEAWESLTLGSNGLPHQRWRWSNSGGQWLVP